MRELGKSIAHVIDQGLRMTVALEEKVYNTGGSLLCQTMYVSFGGISIANRIWFNAHTWWKENISDDDEIRDW